MRPFTQPVTFTDKHVVITGGSSGVGLAIAKLIAREGARITLLARTASKLEAARQEVEQCSNSDASVLNCPTDVTVQAQVEGALEKAVAEHGPVDLLINCAGYADIGYFHELKLLQFQELMATNYYGSLLPTMAVYPSMLARNSGHICFVASGLGLIGFVGYTAYAPSKFAVRGLAECLRNEVAGTGISISIAYPPDVDTPGYEHEMTLKPEEAVKISEGKLYPPERVAKLIIRGIKRGDFVLPNPDPVVGALQLGSATTRPRTFLGTVAEMVLGLVKPLIFVFVTHDHDSTVRNGKQRAQSIARFRAAYCSSEPRRH